MAFYKYTGSSQVSYPTYKITVSKNDVVDFGAGSPPNDGQWQADAGPANNPAVPLNPAPGPAVLKFADGDLGVWSAAAGAFVPTQVPALVQGLAVSFRSYPTGKYPTGTSALPAISMGAGNVATAVPSGADIYVGESVAGFQGNWAGGTAYTTGQGVNLSGDLTSMLWIALKNSTGIQPGTDATAWRQAKLDQRFAFLGDPVAFAQKIDAGNAIWQNGVQNAFINNSTTRSLCAAIQFVGSSIDLLLVGTPGTQVRLTIDGVTDLGRRVIDGVTATSTSLTSATAAFTAADKGRVVAGAGIPKGTYIASVTNATTVVLSAATTASASNVIVNISSWRATGTDNQTHRLNLTWPELDAHTIVCQVAAGYFSGVCIGPNDSIAAGDLPPLPLLGVMGDSVGYGQNVDASFMDTYGYYLGQIMGWKVANESEGGTGTLNPGALAGYQTTIARIPRIAAYKPDVLMNATGLNDQTSANAGYTTVANTTGSASWIATARAALPKALLVGVGPFFTCDAVADPTSYASIAAVRDGQLAAWQAAGATTQVAKGVWAGPGLIYIDSDGWITGKYGVSGTANVVLSSDGIHPLAVGHRYYAKRIAAGILAALRVAGYVL